MKAFIAALYRLMRQAGHPLLWVGLFIALYGSYHYRDRLYWETPSIPFRPYCAVEDDFEPHRPIEGITMTLDFEDEVIKAMADSEVTMKVVYSIVDGFDHRLNTGPHIFVAPVDYYDSQTMLTVTRSALHARQIYLGSNAPESIKGLDITVLNCKDVEGIVSEL